MQGGLPTWLSVLRRPAKRPLKFEQAKLAEVRREGSSAIVGSRCDAQNLWVKVVQPGGANRGACHQPNPAVKRTVNGGAALVLCQNLRRRCRPLTSTLGVKMPIRIVKRVSWPTESESLLVTPSMKRRMAKISTRSAAHSLAVWQAATTDDEVFYAAPRAAYAAYHLGRYAEAREIAHRCLEIALLFKGNWNFGNAVFAGHTVQGLLALRDGNVEEAVNRLRMSAMNEGSPQLGSFGPSMRLAKELLEIGRVEAVTAFLHDSLTFWKMGGEWVEVWERKIRRGKVPNFFWHLSR